MRAFWWLSSGILIFFAALCAPAHAVTCQQVTGTGGSGSPANDNSAKSNTACGDGAETVAPAGTSPNNVVYGSGALATGAETRNAISIGAGATSIRRDTVTIGTAALSEAPFAITLGSRAVTRGQSAIAIGTTGTYAANADGDSSIAIGATATARDQAAIAIGSSANATDKFSTSIGYGVDSGGGFNVAIGTNSAAAGVSAMVLGANSRSIGKFAITVGSQSLAEGYGAMAVGDNSRANGDYTLVFGSGATASGLFALSFGTNASATGLEAIAFGNTATANGANATAIGNNSTATGDRSLAIGVLASATGANATALGAGAVTTRDNQLVLGASTTEVTAPNLAGSGTQLVVSESDGTLRRYTGTAVLNTDLNIAGNQTISGNQSVTGNQSVSGNSAITGNQAVGGTLSVTGPATLNGATTINNSLSVTGDSTFNGNQRVNGNQVVAGSQTVNGNQAIAGNSAVAGNQIIGGSLSVSGPARFSSLAGGGDALVQASSDGTLQRTGTSINQIRISLSNLGQAVQGSGAIATALTAVPQVSMERDELARCGVGTGGYGNQYAVSAGCALRIADRVQLNGALAYTPSIDYGYGSTPTVAGRVGVSFPLGAIDRSKSSAENQIAELKQQLAKLQAAQTAGQAVGPDNTDLVNTLRAEINSLQLKLAEQDARFQKMMEQIRTLLPGGPNKSRQMSSRS